jgi:hypothetical protein
MPVQPALGFEEVSNTFGCQATRPLRRVGNRVTQVVTIGSFRIALRRAYFRSLRHVSAQPFKEETDQ